MEQKRIIPGINVKPNLLSEYLQSTREQLQLKYSDYIIEIPELKFEIEFNKILIKNITKEILNKIINKLLIK